MQSITANDKEYFLSAIKVIGGTILVALTYYIFQLPNGIVAPGLGGISMMLVKVIPIPLGLLYFLLNIPLFLIGYKAVGAAFALLSLIGMSSLSLFLSLFASLPGLHIPIVGCLLGGLLSGVSIGIVILAGGTTGGLDIASVVINRKYPTFSIGKTMMIINGSVLLCSLIGGGLQQTFLTFFSMLLAGKSVDWTLKLSKQFKKGGETI
ncbi:hypothetical protein CN692_09445 [Bacillus sp. AFS002410]|uniref:YitT family protein n=1 Tax=Bacillus sp. AFS002410 TaxID=2033481 RepID=UPI000BEF3FD8|nr:YitT family protein [Bacillus sp. AFS002410]PEJ58485.1 hypothetical protein CN692_09445 [Bacillus sp. AFS002410]